MRKDDEWKTVFWTQYGHFKYQVLLFGLVNAPASFQAYINQVLREHLDINVIMYLDNILIFLKDESTHKADVCNKLGTQLALVETGAAAMLCQDGNGIVKAMTT